MNFKKNNVVTTFVIW